ncbi:MAG: SGNH/GDSL hydrolase family protein [Acidobacteriota bacterium]
MRIACCLFALALLLGASLTCPAAAQTETPRILAFGDSITLGLREPGVDCFRPSTYRGYPARLENRLAALGTDVDIDISAVCGEKTGEGLSRIGTDAVGYDVVLIMEGTNDIASGRPIIGNPNILENLQMMAGKVLEAGAIPVYASVIPFGPTSPGSNGTNNRAGNLSRDLEDIAAAEGLPFVDTFGPIFSLPDYPRLYHSDGYHMLGEGNSIVADAFVGPTQEALALACDAGTPCEPSATRMCLGDGRFSLELRWRTADGVSGDGQAVRITEDTGRFWFFSPENLEVLVKVLDARCNNDHFWVFYGALTDVEYQMVVTDIQTCRRKVYANPLGTFASAGDGFAFPAEPDPGTCGDG